MTDRIEPALTAAEWERPDLAFPVEGADVIQESPAKAIAYANWLLHDDDPRKITRADVELLTGIHAAYRDDGTPYTTSAIDDQLRALADKLASYLPPE